MNEAARYCETEGCQDCRQTQEAADRFDDAQASSAMATAAQRLAGQGIPVEEYPMTVSNLTAATSNLFESDLGAAVGTVP
jgi:hypothetical protein